MLAINKKVSITKINPGNIFPIGNDFPLNIYILNLYIILQISIILKYNHTKSHKHLFIRLFTLKNPSNNSLRDLNNMLLY